MDQASRAKRRVWPSSHHRANSAFVASLSISLLNKSVLPTNSCNGGLLTCSFMADICHKPHFLLCAGYFLLPDGAQRRVGRGNTAGQKQWGVRPTWSRNCEEAGREADPVHTIFTWWKTQALCIMATVVYDRWPKGMTASPWVGGRVLWSFLMVVG